MEHIGAYMKWAKFEIWEQLKLRKENESSSLSNIKYYGWNYKCPLKCHLLSHRGSGFFTGQILFCIHRFMVLLEDDENRKVDMVLGHDSVLSDPLCSSLSLFLSLCHLSVSLSHSLFLFWIVSFGVWFYLTFLIFSGFCCCCFYFLRKNLNLSG